MEDSEEELLKELALRSRDLDSLATRLSGSSESGEDAGSLLEIDGLTASARDVLGIAREPAEDGVSGLTIHISGLDPRTLSYGSAPARDSDFKRLLRLCEVASIDYPLSSKYSAPSGEDEGWILLGSLIVRKDCVIGCEKGSRRRRNREREGEQRPILDPRTNPPVHILTVHLSGMDAWEGRFADASKLASAHDRVCACVWGKDWKRHQQRFQSQPFPEV